MIQASANGILTTFAAGNDRPNFFEILIANDFFDFIMPIFTRNDNDFTDTAGRSNARMA